MCENQTQRIVNLKGAMATIMLPHDDEIEVLSYNVTEEKNAKPYETDVKVYINVKGKYSRYHGDDVMPLPIHASMDVDPADEKQRKVVSRAIAVVTVTLLLMSFVLVAVMLRLSDHIDRLVDQVYVDVRPPGGHAEGPKSLPGINKATEGAVNDKLNLTALNSTFDISEPQYNVDSEKYRDSLQPRTTLAKYPENMTQTDDGTFFYKQQRWSEDGAPRKQYNKRHILDRILLKTGHQEESIVH